MFIPRYWVQAKQAVTGPDNVEYFLELWGYSDASQADAERHAAERIAAAVAKLRNEHLDGSGYPYGARPQREQILDELFSSHQERIAVITRTEYGSIVLNTEFVMFVDVDLPMAFQKPAVKSAGWLSWITGRGPQSNSPVLNSEDVELEKLKQWIDKNGDAAVRVYRTRAGMRYLITSPLFEPGSVESDRAMRTLSCDERYVHLCRVQKCFRARLSPKPWRIGIDRPRHRYPWRTPQAVGAMEKWEEEYGKQAASYATCELIKLHGNHETATPEVHQIVQFHDRMTKATSGLPLA